MSATVTEQATRDRMRRRERAREKERVMRDLDKAWRAFIDSTKGIPESLMSEPGVSGDWSVKDILAHLAAWDRMTVRVVMEILRDDPPSWPVQLQRFDDLNYEADKGLSVTEARNRALSAHKALVEMLDGKAEVRADWIRTATYAHYPEHAEEILAWRRANPRVPDPLIARSASPRSEQETPNVSSAHANVPTPQGQNAPGFPTRSS